MGTQGIQEAAPAMALAAIEGSRTLVVETTGNLMLATKECVATRDLSRGKHIHQKAVESRVDLSDKFVFSSLINMYAKCGSMDDARKIFDVRQFEDVVAWTCLIRGYVDNGQSELGLKLFECMEDCHCAPNSATYGAALKACGNLAAELEFSAVNHLSGTKNKNKVEKLKWLEQGKAIHSQAVMNGCCGLFEESLLVSFYARCGNMVHARSIFDSMKERNGVTWNSLLQGYVDCDQPEMALESFAAALEGSAHSNSADFPNARTFVAALGAFTILAARKDRKQRSECLEGGKAIHSQAVLRSCCNEFVESMLINLYAECGCMLHARAVFDSNVKHNVVSWTALMQGYAENGEGELALELFDVMEGDYASNSRTYTAALVACAGLAVDKDGLPEKSTKWLEKAKAIHSRAVMDRCMTVYVENKLVDLYGKWGKMVHAQTLFDSMLQQNVVAWNSLLKGYVDNGEDELCLALFETIEDVVPDSLTYVIALTACGNLISRKDENLEKWLERGKAVYSRAKAMLKHHCDVRVEATAINMFLKCGNDMLHGRSVFDSIQEPNVVCWNVLLQGYVENGHCEVALELFDVMEENCLPDAATYAAALAACTALMTRSEGGKLEKCSWKWLERGKALHSQAVMNRSSSKFLESSLLFMYSYSGCMVHAKVAFENCAGRNVVSWTVLLQGYLESGKWKLSLELFDDMEEAGCIPSEKTFAIAAAACACLAKEGSMQRKESSNKWLEKGKAIHSRAVRSSCCDTSVEHRFIDVYSNAGRMKHARAVFDSMVFKDQVAWHCLLRGYLNNDWNYSVLETIIEMEARNAPRDAFVYAEGLKACGKLLAEESARVLHAGILRNGFEEDYFVATCLVEFYARCGAMNIAQEISDSMKKKSLISLNALMAGFVLHGHIRNVFQLFEEMKQREEEELVPNGITFTLILNACSHAGLVEQGKKYFHAMRNEYGISPDVRHYGCMVDLLGRANLLDEALELVKSMDMKPDVWIWKSLLGAARKWNNIEVGKVAFEALLELNEEVGAYWNIDAAGDGARKELGSEVLEQTWWTDKAGEKMIQQHANAKASDLVNKFKDEVCHAAPDKTLEAGGTSMENRDGVKLLGAGTTG